MMDFKVFVTGFIIGFILFQVFKCVEAKGQTTTQPDAVGTLNIKAKIIYRCPTYGYVWDNSCDGMTLDQCCLIKDLQEPPTTFTDSNGETWITEGNME